MFNNQVSIYCFSTEMFDARCNYISAFISLIWQSPWSACQEYHHAQSSFLLPVCYLFVIDLILSRFIFASLCYLTRNTFLVDYNVLKSEFLSFLNTIFLKRALNVSCDLVFCQSVMYFYSICMLQFVFNLFSFLKICLGDRS